MKRAVIYISGTWLKHLLTEGNIIFASYCEWGLPRDATFIGMNYDAAYDRFALVFESEEFKQVPEGEPLPVIDMKYTAL